MWKLMQFLTRSTGKSTFKHSNWVCFLFCFLLSAINSFGQSSATNVDFIVVGSAYYLNSQSPVVYDTIPTGCLLFWSVIFDGEQRATIYRSESGHIAFVSNGRLVIAGSDGKPMPWFLNSGLQVSTEIPVAPDGHEVVFYKTTPNILYKNAFDTIPLSLSRGMGSYQFIGVLSHEAGYASYIGRFGDYLMCPVGGNYCRPMYDKQRYSAGLGRYVPGATFLYSTVQGSSWDFERYMLRWAWRSTAFNITLAGFKGHLPSKWWLTGKFVTESTGITSIGVSGGGIGDLVGDGSGGDGVSRGNIPPDTDDYAGGVPGTVDTPPINPIGQNGKWVYDPEKQIWQWQGDLADNAVNIDPYGEDQPLPIYNTGDLAQESTLRKVLQTLEGFSKEQGVTSDQLQSMIDNGVVALKDGMVEYWEGKHLAEKLDAIDSSVEDAADRIDSSVDDAANLIYNVGNSINSRVNVIMDRAGSINDGVYSAAANTGVRGPIVNTLNNVGNNIVDAISDITMPEMPTVEGQETESYEITTPDLDSQIDGWFSSNFPQLTIARTFVFDDYDIGVFGWKIPFSAFNSSSVRIVINTARNIVAWLVYLSAVLGVFKAMGGGV